MSASEGSAAFDAWMHEQGYTYHGGAPITGLTPFEYDKLQLGFAVLNEQRSDAMAADVEGGSSASAKRKRQHKKSIRRRLRNDRARQHYKKRSARQAMKRHKRKQLDSADGGP